tara:strand:+ start:1126 stop:1698 length:573 start_codon:yes stop_codon:yes gene_type:complete
MKSKKYIKYLVFLLMLCHYNNIKATSAEKIIIYKGTIARSIKIDSLENLAKNKEAKGTLKNILIYTGQSKEGVSDALNQEYELPIVLTSKLINSKIGTVILSRISKIIYPDKNPQESISILAIRAGVINGIAAGNGKLNALGFLKAYPNKNIAINYTALSKVINKVESMSDLVEFFTGSPLEKLKNTSNI